MRLGTSLAALAAFVLADDALPPIELGQIPAFASEAAAQHGCPRDLVVWADRDTGYFYPRSRPQFGHTSAGVFTCLDAARGANYWDINPFSPYGSPRAGREFPIDPALLGFGS